MIIITRLTHRYQQQQLLRPSGDVISTRKRPESSPEVRHEHCHGISLPWYCDTVPIYRGHLGFSVWSPKKKTRTGFPGPLFSTVFWPWAPQAERPRNGFWDFFLTSGWKTKVTPVNGQRYRRTRLSAPQGKVQHESLSGSDFLTCMLPTFCPPMIWAMSLEFRGKPSIWRPTVSQEHSAERLWPPKSDGLYFSPTKSARQFIRSLPRTLPWNFITIPSKQQLCNCMLEETMTLWQVLDSFYLLAKRSRIKAVSGSHCACSVRSTRLVADLFENPSTSCGIGKRVKCENAPQHANVRFPERPLCQDSLNGGLVNQGLRRLSTSCHDCRQLSSCCCEISLHIWRPKRPQICTIADDCAQISESGLKPPIREHPFRPSRLLRNTPEYHYTQKDQRTELYYFRIIFGNSCSVITEPICFWN